MNGKNEIEKKTQSEGIIKFNALSPVAEIRLRTEVAMALVDKVAAAKLFIESGFLPETIKTPAQALIVMQTGNDLCLTWTEAFRSINVIHGRPCMSAQLLIALCHRTREVEQAYIQETTPDKAVYLLKRKGQPAFVSIFTRIEADKARFSVAWDKDKQQWKTKDNWEKQPAVMLIWRAMSRAARFVFPDAICGIYTPEEIAEEVALSTDLETNETKVDEVMPAENQTSGEAATQPGSKSREENLGAEDIPDERLGDWTMPAGKYVGRRLIEIIGEQTASGKAKGLEYLEWIVKNAKDRGQARIVERFLEILRKDGAPV